MGSSKVEKIIIPDSVKTIDSYSFVSCIALKRVYVGSGVSIIPTGAFAELSNLKSVTMTDSILRIDDFAFVNCKKLALVAFLKQKHGELAPAGKQMEPEYVDRFENESMLLSIGKYAFAGCKSLVVSVLKSKAVQIGECAFEGCSNENDACAESVAPLLDKTANDFESFDGKLQNKISHKIIPDAPIEVLSLSGRSYNTIYRSRKDIAEAPEQVMISDLVKLTPKKLLQIRDMGTKSAKEIRGRLTSYLSSELLKTSDMSSEIDDNEQTIVPGYAAIDGSIMHTAIRKPFSEINDNEQQTIAPGYAVIDGVITYTEIGNLPSEKDDIEQQTIAPGYAVIDGVITHIESGEFVEDIFVDDIGLGVRATNVLHKNHIMKLSDLICLSAEQLWEYRSMGAKSVSEILEMVPEFLRANHTAELPAKSVESMESALDMPEKVNIPPLSKEYAVLASDYAVVDDKIYHRKTFKLIPDISVDRLNLSVRSFNCLSKNGNARVSSLIGMPYDEFRAIRNLGLFSANEIQEKLEQYLDKAHEASTKQAAPLSTVSVDQILAVFHEHEFDSVDMEKLLQKLPNSVKEA